VTQDAIALGPVPAGEPSARAGESDYAARAFDVVVEYDTGNSVARAHAIRCDREAPTRWQGGPGG